MVPVRNNVSTLLHVVKASELKNWKFVHWPRPESQDDFWMEGLNFFVENL